jgi:DNA-directed RNA polymerase subunit L
MNIKIIKNDKSELKVEVDNITIVEILRFYLNKDDAVKFAAWRREHPSKSPILHIKTSGKTAKKTLQDAISKIEKETGKLSSEFKKAK